MVKAAPLIFKMVISLSKHPLATYGLKDFDKYNCLTLSYSFYAVLIYLLKGYVIGMVSLSNFKDKLTVIQWFYPESSLFYLSLLIGLPGLFLMSVIFQRKPDARNWVKYLWQHIFKLCLVLVLIDVAIYWALYLFLQVGQLSWLVGQNVLAIAALLYCRFSRRAIINRQEFPEEIVEDKAPKKRRSPL